MAHVTLLLRIGDTALVLAQQLGALVGWGPTLEEEVATANIALDLVGQATLVLDHAGAVENLGRDSDTLAFLRDAHEFRNALMVELPNGDFASVVVRQALYSAWSFELWKRLTSSTDTTLASIARKAVKETAYHVDHAGSWFVRLGDGTDESRRRMQQALDALWPYTGELFGVDDVADTVAEEGLSPRWSELEADWNRRVDGWFAQTALVRPDGAWMHEGGLVGRHTEHLGYILAEMESPQRAYPGATW